MAAANAKPAVITRGSLFMATFLTTIRAMDSNLRDTVAVYT
jgi:hypothetical protein